MFIAIADWHQYDLDLQCRLSGEVIPCLCRYGPFALVQVRARRTARSLPNAWVMEQRNIIAFACIWTQQQVKLVWGTTS